MKTPILEESASWMALVSATTPDSSLPLSAPSKKAISKRTRAVRYCRRMRFACRWLVVSQHAISRYAEPKAAMESQQNQRMIRGGGRGEGVPRAKGGGAAAAAGAGVKPPRLPKQLSPRAAAAAARTGLSTSLMRWLPSSAFTSAPKISVKLRGGSLVVTIKSIWHANGPMRAERHIHGKLRAPWESETVQNSCPKQSPQQPGALTTAHDAPGLHRAGAGGAESARNMRSQSRGSAVRRSRLKSAGFSGALLSLSSAWSFSGSPASSPPGPRGPAGSLWAMVVQILCAKLSALAASRTVVTLETSHTTSAASWRGCALIPISPFSTLANQSSRFGNGLCI